MVPVWQGMCQEGCHARHVIADAAADAGAVLLRLACRVQSMPVGLAMADAIRCEVVKNLVRLTPAELVVAIRHQLEEQGVALHAGQPTGWT